MADPGSPRFLGGHVALDFVNTIDWRLDPARLVDLLPDYAALLDWSLARGTLTPAAVARLRALSRRDPAGAAAAHGEALAVRAAVIAAASALHGGGALPLAELNTRLAALPPMPGLEALPDGRVATGLAGAALAEPAWPVLWSAATLLAGGDAGRVQCCAAQGCGWFFLDTSPNRRRLWCDSAGCGNRERVRRAYARRRGTAPA